MLLTTCPNCSAQFKVQPEQLNIRQGRVMCGRCRKVFNAFQSLTRVEGDESQIGGGGGSRGPAVSPIEPFADLKDALFVGVEPSPSSEDMAQTDFASDLRSSPPLSSPTRVSVFGDAPVQAISPKSISPAAHSYTEIKGPAEGGNPLLATGSRYRQPVNTSHPARWIAGTVILSLILTAQLAYAFRSAVVQFIPEIRPAYVSACEWAGCTLSWGRDDSAIRIEASDLIELPGKAGRILLTATLVNRGTSRQDLPALELKLTDSANQVLLSRVLLPGEYLGRIPAKNESLVPNDEMYVNLSFELSQKAQASGYGVRAFYY